MYPADCPSSGEPGGPLGGLQQVGRRRTALERHLLQERVGLESSSLRPLKRVWPVRLND